MKKREHRPTSKQAHDSMKNVKAIMYSKIVEGLKKLKVGGNFEEISVHAGLKPSQVWKRLPEMVELGMVYNCGYTHKTSSGRSAMVRQLIGLGYKNENQEPVKKKKEPEIKLQKQLDLFQ
jgi:hypothetical protein